MWFVWFMWGIVGVAIIATIILLTGKGSMLVTGFADKNSIDFSVSFYNYHEPSIYPCL